MSTDSLDSTVITEPAGPAPEPFIKIEALMLPIDLLRPGKFQPRKRFDAEALQELADSIARKGVQQAIVVRGIEGAKPGEPRFEIVVGERRWRACKILAASGNYKGPYLIPAFPRVLDDFEAAEIALTENVDRSDLHPLEEAEAYENLLLRPVGGGEFKPPRLRGLTVEQIAERIGHKPNFVFGRLKLLELIPAAREAFLDDKIQLKVAEPLARMAIAEQERALPDLLRGWAGEPYTHRQAVAYLRQHFMLKLVKAGFDPADATLVPAAGACKDCQKRSGANPDLFGDGNADDMCLDSACHQSKVAAHAQRTLDHAREAGQTVLTGKAAEKVLGGAHLNDYSLRHTGHVNLAKPDEELTGSKKTLRTLLGADFQGTMVVKGDNDDEPITVAKLDDVKAALKAKGLLRASTKSKPGQPGKPITAEDLLAQRRRRIEKLLYERLPGTLWKHLASDDAFGFPSESKVWMHELAHMLYEASELNFDALERAATGSTKVGGRIFLDELDGEALNRACITMLLGHLVNTDAWRKTAKPETADALAADIEFDLPALRSEVQAEVDEALRAEIAQLAEVVEPAKPKAAPRKTPARKKPSKGTSTPSSDAAAQGNPSPAEGKDEEQLTPEKALADAVARDTGVDVAKLTGKANKPSRKTNQTDKPAQPPAAQDGHITAEAAWPFTTSSAA